MNADVWGSVRDSCASSIEPCHGPMQLNLEHQARSPKPGFRV